MKKIRLKKVLERVEADLIPSETDVESLYITGVNTLKDAEEGDVSFLGSKKYSSLVKETKATFVIVDEDLLERVKDVEHKIFLVVENAYFAFSSLLNIFSDRPKKSGVSENSFIAGTAELPDDIYVGENVYIGDDVRIGKGTKIYSGCVVEDGCVLGGSCILYPNVVLRYSTKLGNKVIVQPGAILGSDGFGFVKKDGRIHKIEQIGNVVIGDDVEIGANVTIDRASLGSTVVGSGTKIDNLVHIAHSVKIGKNCFIVAQVGISGSVEIGDNVTLAGQCGVVGHLRIDDNSVVAARSVVMNNIEKNSFVSGFPAISHVEDMKLKAHIRKLPMVFKKLRKIIDFNEKD